MAYIAGDFLRICDVCGFQYRASQTRRRWDNLIVCNADYEERHPQDHVRGRKDSQNVPDPRPEPIDNIIGPLTTITTAAAVPGATTLSVEASIRMESGDDIGIMLASGDTHRAQIDVVPDGISLTLTAPLPGSVASGALVINYDAVAESGI